MVLHLLPVDRHWEEVRLLPSEPRPALRGFADWSSDPARQVITHEATGCQFHAYPVSGRLVEGLLPPSAPLYEIAVQFIGMAGAKPVPPSETVRELALQGIEWILKYTAEARRR